MGNNVRPSPRRLSVPVVSSVSHERSSRGQEGRTPQVQAEGVQTVQEQSPQTRPEGVRLVYYITSWAASPPFWLTSCVRFHPPDRLDNDVPGMEGLGGESGS